MNIRKKLIQTTVLTLIPFFTLGQLAGSYTVGGINPDFQTISLAVYDIISHGASAPVIFNIRSGSYSEVIPSLYLFDPATPITFQSEQLDSTTVTITNPNASGSVFTVGGFINFNELTIIDSSSYPAISGDYDLCVHNCIIHNLEAIGMSSGIIDNCRITGRISVFGYEGIPYYFINDSITGDVDLVHGDSYCYGNYFNGNLSISYTNNVFENNFFAPGWDSWAAFNFGKHSVKNNIFHGVRFVDISHADSSELIGNDIQIILTSSLAYGDNSVVVGNKFYSNFSISYCKNSMVANNFFSDGLSMDYCDSSSFIFNNCRGDSGQIFMNGFSFGLLVENNNMPAGIYNPYQLPMNLLNNNYFHIGSGLGDAHPYFIDPMYANAMDLHATNPQLIGKGLNYLSINSDIDSLLRPYYPSIGANEICLSDDTLNVACQDSIILALCNIPDTGNFFWSPSIGLSDPYLARPVFSGSTSNMYTIRDTISGFADSIYVNVIPFNVTAYSDDSLICGIHTFLFATYNANATYQWSPIDSLISPYSYFTEAFPSFSTTYFVTATIPGCGTTSDSVTLIVNPFPTAYCGLDSVNFNFYSFLNLSLCGDTYYWDFGDSTGSTDINPTHIYLNGGAFLVTLIACNSYGCDTFQGYVNVDSVVFGGISSSANSNQFFTVYPNPTQGSFNILCEEKNLINSIEVINFMGDILFRKENLESYSIQFDLSDQPTGFYLVRISNSRRTVLIKVIVSK